MKTEVLLHLVRPLLLGTTILLAFAGCGANHVGETWQCPLSQGTQCASVESVDPAVRPAIREIELPPLEALTVTAPVAADSLDSAVASHGIAVADRVDRAGPEPCGSSCNPLGRFWRWLTGSESADPTIAEAGESETLAASTNPAVTAEAGDEVQTASPATVPISARLESAAGEGRADKPAGELNVTPESATSPAVDTGMAAGNTATANIAARNIVAEQPDSLHDVAPESRNFPDTDTDPDLVTGARSITPGHVPIASLAEVRIPEKIGRIWIAPWVDANGVYREGAWVRVVISAATWRRP